MSDTNNGGPAFSQPAIMGERKIISPSDNGEAGMTLRDYFAATALQGLISGSMADGSQLVGGEDVAFSQVAYKFADAMLKARAEA